MSGYSWAEFEAAAPEIADYGRQRLDGKVAYLATVRDDQKPRLHPVTPIIGAGSCFLFVEPSTPKAKDLLDIGWYSLHCAMSDSSGSSGEFVLNGRVRFVEAQAAREVAESVSSYRPAARALLFELSIDEAHAIEYPFGRPLRKKFPSAVS